MTNAPPAHASAGFSAPDPPLVVEGLGFRWPNGSLALDHINLEVPRPGLWMLVGGNGSGKSTLLRLIAGLLDPQRGRIHRQRTPALVFQNPDHQLLLPSCGTDLQLSLAEGLSREERRWRVAEALAQVGLPGLEGRPIHTLSGGQKQRVAIAGALASGADLLLLDEPTALLDPISQTEVLELIHRLCHRQERPLTALWITHRLEELERCDGAVLMESGRMGRWQDGPELCRRLRGRVSPLPGGATEG